MEFGICLDWGDLNVQSKQPSWIRKKAVRPCECKFCFVFCKEGRTNGIFHQEGAKQVRRRKRKAHNVQCSAISERF